MIERTDSHPDSSATLRRLEPRVLESDRVRLEPLRRDHGPAIGAIALHPEIWEFTAERIAGPHDLDRWLASALADAAAGRALPFAIVDLPSGTVVGSTRFGNYEPSHRRIEIGWTFLAPRWQRTAVNTGAKLLLLRHAFETLGCRRVEFKTDALNERSRRALARIGAREEGVLRRHMLTASGRVRDTVYYSLLDEEWPQVEQNLLRLLNKEP